MFPFSTCFHANCSQEIKNIIHESVRRVPTTRSSTYSHSFKIAPPNPWSLAHKLSFILELLNCGTHIQPLPSLNPTLLNPTSTHLILSLSLLKLPYFLSFSFNFLQPALKFTIEKEQNKSLKFLDVLVEKEGTRLLTSITGNQRLLGNTSIGIPSAQRQERLAWVKL